MPFCRTRSFQKFVLISGALEAKGTTLARLFDSWYDTKATYNLLKQTVMTPDRIQNPHRKIAYQNIENWQGDVLAIEASSEFEWNHKEPIKGLGPVGSGRDCDQGFILHSTLAIGVKLQGRLEVLGLPLQQYYVQPPVREERKRRGRTNDVIETDLWRNVIKEKALPANSKVIRVCDRAADIYEGVAETKAYGCSVSVKNSHLLVFYSIDYSSL